MARRILVINAHPDPDPARLCHALSAAYAEAAAPTHTVDTLALGALDFPAIRSRDEYENAAPPPAIARAQTMIEASNHVAFVFPIWLGGPPSRMNAFLEQTLRPGFARERKGDGAMGAKRMTGRSARLIVTMGMPALAYRFYFWDHGLANLRRAVLGFVGFGPIRTTLVGSAGDLDPARAARWLETVRLLGARGI